MLAHTFLLKRYIIEWNNFTVIYICLLKMCTVVKSIKRHPYGFFQQYDRRSIIHSRRRRFDSRWVPSLFVRIFPIISLHFSESRCKALNFIFNVLRTFFESFHLNIIILYSAQWFAKTFRFEKVLITFLTTFYKIKLTNIKLLNKK